MLVVIAMIMSLNRCSVTSETDRGNLTAAPVIPVYAEPVVNTRKLKQNNSGNMEPDAYYSLIGEANMSTEGEMKREMYYLLKDVTSGEDSHDNPVYGLGASGRVNNEECLHLKDAVTGGTDTEYSRLDHSSAANTHVSTSEQQYSFL